ncbi:MAG: XRE family transcriptional regulator [Alphaproteobacteria bacterium]|nr:XRE family transcriptional regulator [Alphaproteobacteria bacterium]MBM3655326.1 XRE family transcriptional regulator [Alphaproteobacteria bacterium]
MTVAESRRRLGITPRLLRRERAAAYLDMSATSFEKLVKEGVLPAPKKLHSFKVWDRDELDALADALQHDSAVALDESWSD